MRYLIKLGPVEFDDEPPSNFYLSVAEQTIDQEWGDDDVQALARLTSRGPKEPTCCEPQLATAAAALGLQVAELPDGAVALKAAMAVSLDFGEGLEPNTAPGLVLELIDALAAFDEAQVWTQFDPDEVVELEVKKPKRTLDAVVMGQMGEVYGLALYDAPGALADVDPDDVRALPCTSIWLERGPSFALDAVRALTGRSFSPGGVRMKHGDPTQLSTRDLATLVASLRALTTLAAGPAAEAAGRAGESRTRIEVRARRLELPDHEEPSDELFANIGRNEPCPCGSGKKFKHCHLGAHDSGAVSTGPHQKWHDRDRALVDELLSSDAAREAFTEAFRGRSPDLQLGPPIVAYEWPKDGRPLAARWLEAHGARLPADERAAVEAQLAARTRLWEVLRVEKGKGFEVLDLLSFERCFADEQRGSEQLVARDVLLGRLVRRREGNVFGGLHLAPLLPAEAKPVVDAARAEKLDDGSWKSTVRLLALWDQAVGDRALRLASPSTVRNTDGHRAVLVEDELAVRKGSYASVFSRLAALEGAAVEEGKKQKTVITLTRPGDEAKTIVASVTLSERKMIVFCNSLERADALKERLAAALGDHVTWRARKQDEVPDRRGGRNLVIDSQRVDAAGLLAAGRTSWLDGALPLLGGRTPREAVNDAAGREAVHWLLKEQENLEARQGPSPVGPTGQQLRRELGLDELGAVSPHRELDRAVGFGRRMSETMLDFAKPLLEGPRSPDDIEQALWFAGAVWNIVALEEQGADEERLAGERARIRPGKFPAALMKFFDALVRRKREAFGGDLRLAGACRVDAGRQGFSVFLETMLTPELAAKVNAAGLRPER